MYLELIADAGGPHLHGGGLGLKREILLKRWQATNYVGYRLLVKTAQKLTCITICEPTTAVNMNILEFSPS